jgi:hypothetical protein
MGSGCKRYGDRKFVKIKESRQLFICRLSRNIERLGGLGGSMMGSGCKRYTCGIPKRSK